jgi:nitroreductase
VDHTLSRRRLLGSAALAAVLPAPAVGGSCDLDALLGRRRMVRRFRADPVSDEVVRRLIDMATRAPSAGNTQPWGFVVVRDRERRRQLGAAAFGQTWLAEAPVSVVPCADPSPARPRYGDRSVRYALIDTAFASLLLLLGVTEAGLGACFVGAFDDDRVRSILRLPAHVQPLAVVPIGYPAETPSPRSRRRLGAVVHDEYWRP